MFLQRKSKHEINHPVSFVAVLKEIVGEEREKKKKGKKIEGFPKGGGKQPSRGAL